MAPSKVLLVDGHSFAYRAFHAIQRLTNSRGQPTNAAFGFAKMIRKLAHDHQPTHQAVVLDLGEPAQRLAQWQQYKAQRKPMPADLRSQLPLIRTFLEVSAIPLIEKEGFEADDLIATLCARAREHAARTLIATGDKDLMQLVGPNTVLLNPAAREGGLVDAAAVQSRYGVLPDQIVDLLSLTGDASDNIPGVPGVGEKTAARLLGRFGSVAELYRRLEEISDPRLRQKLLEHRPQVERNRDLIRLDSHVPLNLSLDELRVRAPDIPRLLAWCEELEFRSLADEIRREAERDSNPELALGT